MTLTGTSSPEPSVTKDEGPGTTGPESPDSNLGQHTRVKFHGVRLSRNTILASYLKGKKTQASIHRELKQDRSRVGLDSNVLGLYTVK